MYEKSNFAVKTVVGSGNILPGFIVGGDGNRVYISFDKRGRTLEINGVVGTIEEWKEVLLPLLN